MDPVKHAFHAIAVLLLLAAAGCSQPGSPDGSTGGTSEAGAAAGLPVPDLAAYVGKYPFDKVNGVTWENNRLVIDGVHATVSDPEVAKRVLDYTGPATPIAMVDGKVVAGVCETHNCGGHNWEIFIDTDGGGTEVCYHDESRTPGQSVWYLPGGKREHRPGACSIA